MRCIQRRRHNSSNVVRNRRKHFNFPIDLGNIKFILSGKSSTVGSVLAFNDNATSLPQININSPQAILDACRGILKLTLGKAKPYKLDVYQNTEYLFTVRSVYYGSRRTMDEFLADIYFIDHQDIVNVPI